MAQYVDGFVIPVPKRNLEDYRKMAQLGAKIWREHGALDYKECIGEDLGTKMGAAFPRALGIKPNETVVFSWIVFKSRAHRDRVNAKVMSDPRMKMDDRPMPFDLKRMVYGGFEVLVDGAARGARRAAAKPELPARRGARGPSAKAQGTSRARRGIRKVEGAGSTTRSRR